jgi:hypothetical protein|tara:strand:+ start:250 stop:582 length:333 start_codon:yes stop_codon:yes gene_type:complete
MKKIVLILLLFFVVSCNSSFEKLKSIDQLEGRWESKKDIIKIDTDKMTISYNKDSMTLILSSRPYDRSKITVSSGSVMYFDAHVYINNNGSTIRIDEIHSGKSQVYKKIQ